MAMTNEDKLRAFAEDVIAGMSDYNDEGDVQDLAVKHGLLAIVEIAEPCGEFCQCAEVTEFPTGCYRKTPLLTGGNG